MKKTLSASAAAVLALAVAIPAFAGGSHCGGASATTADAKASCAGKTSAAAWAGAWLERSASGNVTVAEVAKGSPAQKSGLKPGDIVLAVNGYRLADSEEHAMCVSKAECKVGCALTYTVQRGSSTKSIRLKLAKMPANATARFGGQAEFDPALAALVVTPTAN
jgi:C-terminal processing protease CtpA/Prc